MTKKSILYLFSYVFYLKEFFFNNTFTAVETKPEINNLYFKILWIGNCQLIKFIRVQNNEKNNFYLKL
jgi:hypothetical protein